MQIVDTRELTKEFSKLKTSFELVGENAFPATRYAAGRASAHIQQTWIWFASGHPIPGYADRSVNNVEYRNSIRRVKISPFDYLIFVADDKVGDKVEEAQPRIDLKTFLPFPKSRISKDGEPYSHIPFRHRLTRIRRRAPRGTVSKIVKMEKSFVTGSFKDVRGIKRYSYKWAKREKTLDRSLKGTQFQGIVRFETSTGEGSSSAYMTFRTISTKSPPDSWIIKARPGIPLSEIVEENTRGTVIRIIREGIEADLKGI